MWNRYVPGCFGTPPITPSSSVRPGGSSPDVTRAPPIVQRAEREVAELRADLVGHDEARVDRLARLVVAEERAVLRARDRVLDRPEELHERAELLVFERSRQAQAEHAVAKERRAERASEALGAPGLETLHRDHSEVRALPDLQHGAPF